MNHTDGAAQDSTPIVHRSTERERYWLAPESGGDEQTLGLLLYADSTDADGTLVRDLRSTIIPEEQGGRGFGSLLVRTALEDARREDARIIATCWFARGWITRHPEYHELLVDGGASLTEEQ